MRGWGFHKEEAKQFSYILEPKIKTKTQNLRPVCLCWKMERGQSMGGGEKSWVSMWCDGGAWKAEHFVMWTNSLKSWHKWNWSNFSKEIFDFRKMASCAWNLLYPKTQFEASKNRTFLHHSDQILWQAKKKPDSPTHFLPEEIESGNLARKEGTSAISA